MQENGIRGRKGKKRERIMRRGMEKAVVIRSCARKR